MGEGSSSAFGVCRNSSCFLLQEGFPDVLVVPPLCCIIEIVFFSKQQDITYKMALLSDHAWNWPRYITDKNLWIGVIFLVKWKLIYEYRRCPQIITRRCKVASHFPHLSHEAVLLLVVSDSLVTANCFNLSNSGVSCKSLYIVHKGWCSKSYHVPTAMVSFTEISFFNWH